MYEMLSGVLAAAGKALLVVLYAAVRHTAEWFAAFRIRTLVFSGELLVKVVELLLHCGVRAALHKEIDGDNQGGDNDDNSYGRVYARNETDAHARHGQDSLQTLLVGRPRRIVLYLHPASVILMPYTFQRSQ